MFQEECAAFGVTPVQYSLLSLVQARAGMDQRSAAAGCGSTGFTTRRCHPPAAAAGCLTGVAAGATAAPPARLTTAWR